MIRLVYTTFVAGGMFIVRMLMLGLMTLLQLTLGGAEIRPASRETDAA
jgi:hypothetical protein